MTYKRIVPFDELVERIKQCQYTAHQELDKRITLETSGGAFLQFEPTNDDVTLHSFFGRFETTNDISNRKPAYQTIKRLMSAGIIEERREQYENHRK